MNPTDRKIKILVLRFSALGDIAMTVPVLWSLRKQYPNVDITFVSRSFAKTLVEKIPGVKFFPLETSGKHKGFFGLLHLFKTLNRMEDWDGVADLHDVLRTKFLRFLFRIKFVNVSHIDKGRKEKRKLTRKRNKNLLNLKHSVIRYRDVFSRLGIDIDVDFNGLSGSPAVLSSKLELITDSKKTKWIGIAPFAKHLGKTYPISKMEKVINNLSQNNDYKIFLFGGGEKEEKSLHEIELKYQKVVSLVGKLTLAEELDIMSNLDVMISMDSANMHLASLTGIPVVSIWGATHPYAGFYAWNQPLSNAVQFDIECCPCSVFGNKPCFRKDYACLNQIEPEMVLKAVYEKLN